MASDLATGEMAFATDTGAVFISNGQEKRMIGHVMVDVSSNMPLPGVAGRTFLDSQTGGLYVDTPSGWVSVGNVDNLDGDRLPIDWVPVNSTPIPAENLTETTYQLTSHLKGIDQAIGSKSDSGHDHSTAYPPLSHGQRHISGAVDEIDGDMLDVDWSPETYTPRIVGETTSESHLSSHLKGMDLALASMRSGIESLENTLIMMAWDLYSQDRTFDDIYIDDLSDTSGMDATLTDNILGGNCSGIYDSELSLVRSVGLETDVEVEVSGQSVDCSSWSSINSVSVTQSTPGNLPASQVYHAISFDGRITWKVFRSGLWVSIARNDAGTWQYLNGGTWKDASYNSEERALAEATDQTGYRWTRDDIEAMTSMDWSADSGWSRSVTSIDWSTRLVNGWSVIGHGSQNPETADVVVAQTDGSNVVWSSQSSGYEGWKVFDDSYGAAHRWLSEANQTTGWIRYDFGPDNRQVINKYRWRTFEVDSSAVPGAWQFQGSDDGSSWTTLHEGSNTLNTANTWMGWFEFSNATFYRYYRMNITANRGHPQYLSFDELEMVKAQSVATPTFSSVTFNHNVDAVPLMLTARSWEASADDPDDAYCVIELEQVDSVTPNTDIRAFVTINDGANWEQITLENQAFRKIGSREFLRGDIYGINARIDRRIRFRFESHNQKTLKIHAIAGGVRYHD